MILKLMVLLVLYDVRSQRELMATVSERLDWLWFLGFDLKLRGQYTKLMTSVRVQAHVINLVYCPRNSTGLRYGVQRGLVHFDRLAPRTRMIITIA